MPAAAPAIAVVHRGPTRTDAGATSPITLVDSGGRTVPTTVVDDPIVDGIQLIVPTTALEPGSYRLEGVLCEKSTSAPKTVNTRFSVTAGGSLPAGIGTVVVKPVRREIVPVPGGAACEAQLEASLVKLEVTLSPEMQRLAPLAQFSTFVDGQPWAVERYGRIRIGHPIADGRKFDELYGLCEQTKEGHNGLSAGKHHGELRVHIAGASVAQDPPPVTFDFELDCGHKLATNPHDGGSDGGLNDATPSGCSVAPSRNTGPGDLVFLSIPMLALARGVQRRRQHAKATAPVR